MSYFLLAIDWIVGLSFLMGGLLIMTKIYLGALPFFAIALLYLPPVRKYYAKRNPNNFNETMTGKFRAALSFFVLVIGFLVFGIISVALQEKIISYKNEHQRNENERIVNEENNKYFSDNRPAIIEKIKKAIDFGDYTMAISVSDKYLSSNDDYLISLRSIAKEQFDKIKAAENEKNRIKAERENKIKIQFSKYDGSHINLEKIIKDNANDPDSYKHVETVYWDKDSYLIVKTTFRGKNAFGGVVKNSVKAMVDLDGQVLQIIEQE